MKIGLYASMNNGDVFNKDIPYIAVDGGLEHLHRQSIKPLCAIGDFDSLQHKEYLEGLEVLTFLLIRMKQIQNLLLVKHSIEVMMK